MTPLYVSVLCWDFNSCPDTCISEWPSNDNYFQTQSTLIFDKLTSLAGKIIHLSVNTCPVETCAFCEKCQFQRKKLAKSPPKMSPFLPHIIIRIIQTSKHLSYPGDTKHFHIHTPQHQHNTWNTLRCCKRSLLLANQLPYVEPRYWLLNRKAYNGLLYSPHNRVVFHPLYTLNNQLDTLNGSYIPNIP